MFSRGVGVDMFWGGCLVMVDTTCHTHTHVHMSHLTSLCSWVAHVNVSCMTAAFGTNFDWKETIAIFRSQFLAQRNLCLWHLELLPKGSHLKQVLLLDPLPKGTLSPNPKPRGVEETPLVQRGWQIGINGMANPGTGITRTGHQELAQWAMPGGRRWDRRPWPEKQLKPLPKGIKTKLQQMQQHQLQQMQQHQLQQMQQHQLQHQAAQKAPPAAAAPACMWMPRGQKQSLSNLLTKGMRKKVRKKMRKNEKKKEKKMKKWEKRRSISWQKGWEEKGSISWQKGCDKWATRVWWGKFLENSTSPTTTKAKTPCQKGRDHGPSARTRAWRHLDPEAEQEHQSSCGLAQCDGGQWGGQPQVHSSCARLAGQWLPGVHGVLLWPAQTTSGAPEGEAVAPGVH